MKKLLLLLFFAWMSCHQSPAFARGIEQKPAEFIKSLFTEGVPKAQVLWLSKSDKVIIEDILQHKFTRLRIRYWQKKGGKVNQSVWILDEIGKEKPITIGVQIKNQQIVQLKVLAYRESRGDEVRHRFFTKQFNLAKLTKNNTLDRHIDGITGATLSVRALTKVARVALWLDKKINTQ